LPHLEALLRLGRIDEANELYDELIRLDSMPVRSIAAADHAANVAKSLGMKETADIYGQGRPTSNVPWYIPQRNTYFFLNTRGYDIEYHKQFDELIEQLAPRISSQPANIHYGKDIDSLGWKKDDGPRWALVASDGRVMAQDSNIPTLDEMQTLYSRFGIENGIESCKKYLAAHSGLPGLEMRLAYSIVLENINALRGNQNTAPLDDIRDDALWGDAAKYLRKVLAEHPEILVNLSTEIWYDGVSIESQLLRAISKPMLTNIESLLGRKPSSDALWMQWLFWKDAEGDERSIEPLIDRIKLSPITQVGIVPPAVVIDTYYEDCKKSGSWGKVRVLLKAAWDREFSRTDAKMGFVWWGYIKKDSLGDKLGIYLIEAYLQDGRPNDANEIFNAVLGIGGKFTDISIIIDLAKEKAQDRLAREWGERVKK
jgi:tetratricopeptide (TPR) repeat protein